MGAVVLALNGEAHAQLPPWVQPGDLPVPSHAKSVIAAIEETPVFSSPRRNSQRRGVVAAMTPLPFFSLTRGPGCHSRWLQIGPLAWLCQDQARFSASPPIAFDAKSYTENDEGLPYRYYFVQRDGTPAYSQFRFIDIASPTATLDKGFGVAIIRQRTHAGLSYGLTTYGLWIALVDLALARPAAFHGGPVVDGQIDFGWVRSSHARAYRKASTASPSPKSHPRFERVTITDTHTRFGRTFYHLLDGTWLQARDIARPSLATPPSEVGPSERWIDVDLGSQTLVAYQGATPVYATMISAGKGRQGTALATPKGVHRVWVKLIASTMDNFENNTAQDYYSIEDVPYVQYFYKGVGLHAAFWHNRFGYRHSHGCVNLPPVDAQWLFAWTSPHLPAGWRAVFPTKLEKGTVIRVR